MTDRIHQTRYESLKAINNGLINLYWDLGKVVSEKMIKDEWGNATVETLSKDLQVEFPGIGGFSVPNLRKMRQFYEAYKNNEKLSQDVRGIAWGHNILIIQQVKDEKEREFYITMSTKLGWSRGYLLEKIQNNEYQNYINNQNNFDKTISIERLDLLTWQVKDEYTFGFVGLNDEASERDLEEALVQNIVKFIAEMGGDFCFMGRQYRVVAGDQEFFIDLLFYHRKLKSMVAIELKAGKFDPRDVGQLSFYLTLLDQNVKNDDEGPSIGIIICKSKDRTVVEYALNSTKSPMGVATFKYNELPEFIAKYLPNEDELKKRLISIKENE